MILRRYMTQQVASTTALVLGFLLVLLLGGRMIRYFGIAAEGRLDVGLLFAIIGYNLPYFLELVLPLSFFIGLMLVFGRLYVDNEMAVLNGSGISRGRLARLMIPFILLLFIAEAGVSMFAKPWGVRNSDSIWQQQSLNSAFDLIRPKSFISSEDYHLYVGSMNEDNTELRDVILIQTGGVKPASDADVEIEKSIMDSSRLENSTTKDSTIKDSTAEEQRQGENSQRESQEVSVNQDRVTTENSSNHQTDSDEAGMLETILGGDAQAQSESMSLEDNETIKAITDPISTAQQQSSGGTSRDDDVLDTVNTDARTDGRDIIVLAKRAVQVEGNEDSSKTQLDLYQGRRYEVGADSLVYNQVSFERYRISLEKPPKDVVAEDNVTAQPISVLWRVATGNPLPISTEDTPTQSTSNTEISAETPVVTGKAQVLAAQGELGYRLALPWLMIIAPMLAVPLAQVRPRQGRWLRLLPAIMIFTSCALVIISLKSSVSKGNLTVWSYLLVIIGFMVLALYLNWASRIHHRVRFSLGQHQHNNNEGMGSGSGGKV